MYQSTALDFVRPCDGIQMQILWRQQVSEEQVKTAETAETPKGEARGDSEGDARQEMPRRPERRERRRRSNELRPLEVTVENNNVARALSQLKREMARDGIRKELKRRRFYEKPSVKKRRKWRDAERRRRKERRRARMAR